MTRLKTGSAWLWAVGDVVLLCEATASPMLMIAASALYDDWFLALVFVTLGIPLGWSALVMASAIAAAARCHVTVNEGLLTARWITPGRAQIPLFHIIRVPFDHIRGALLALRRRRPPA